MLVWNELAQNFPAHQINEFFHLLHTLISIPDIREIMVTKPIMFHIYTVKRIMTVSCRLYVTIHVADTSIMRVDAKKIGFSGYILTHHNSFVTSFYLILLLATGVALCSNRNHLQFSYSTDGYTACIALISAPDFSIMIVFFDD